jgi:hypothetical protein
MVLFKYGMELPANKVRRFTANQLFTHFGSGKIH